MSISASVKAINKNKIGNPWKTIWLHPRKTFQKILRANSYKYVDLLAIISGINLFLYTATWRDYGNDSPLLIIVIWALTGGALAGILTLYLSGIILKWAGKLLGRKVEAREIRIGIAWASLPEVILFIVISLTTIGFGQKWYMPADTWMSYSFVTFLMFTYYPIMIIFLLLKYVFLATFFSETFSFALPKVIAMTIVYFLIARVIFTTVMFFISV